MNRREARHTSEQEALYANGAVRKGPARPSSNHRRATYNGPGASSSGGGAADPFGNGLSGRRFA
jgi:hypothetical protein